MPNWRMEYTKSARDENGTCNDNTEPRCVPARGASELSRTLGIQPGTDHFVHDPDEGDQQRARSGHRIPHRNVLSQPLQVGSCLSRAA